MILKNFVETNWKKYNKLNCVIVGGRVSIDIIEIFINYFDINEKLC